MKTALRFSAKLKICFFLLVAVQILWAVSSSLSAIAESKKGAAKVSAWKIRQTSNLIGPLQCLVSERGVRLNAEKLGLLWIFKAPDWDAYLYNQETKNYCSFKYEVWKKRGFFMTGGTSRRKAPSQGPDALKKTTVKKTGKTMKIANLKAEQVELHYNNGIKYGEFWFSSQIDVPEQFKEVVANMLHLPLQQGGTPLKAIVRNKTGKLVPVLETVSASQVVVDAGLFKPLKGYERVKDEMALLFSGSELFGGDNRTMAGEGVSKQKK